MEETQAAIQEQMAFELQRQYGDSYDFAWVSHQGKTYFTRYPKVWSGPSSAIVKLIQFLFDDHVDHSFFILRNRIFTTASISPMCEGMVQLAAKRATGFVNPQDHQEKIETQWVELGSEHQHTLKTKHPVQVDWHPPMMVGDSIEAYFHLQNLISKVPRGDVLHDYNRPIAAMVVSKDGHVLSWAVNNNSKNKTLHAEVAAVQKYYETFGRKLPPGVRIYASLKPCRMCAGMIIEMAEDPKSIQTIFFQDDPGPLAQNTVLERQKLLKHYLLQDAGT